MMSSPILVFPNKETSAIRPSSLKCDINSLNDEGVKNQRGNNRHLFLYDTSPNHECYSQIHSEENKTRISGIVSKSIHRKLYFTNIDVKSY